MSELHVGYVLKRFPRASETFIAQEILELERQGVRVSIYTLRESDVSAPHQWVSEVSAPVRFCGDLRLSETWKWLHRRSQDSRLRPGVEAALWRAFRHPSLRARHRLREAVAIAQAAENLGVRHLHCHFANDPTFTTLLAHNLLRLPFSFTAHAKDIYAAGPSSHVWNDQVEQASFAVTVSDDNRKHIASLLPEALEGKVRRLYNGIDLDRIQPRAGELDSPFRVLTVARLVPKKGVDLLLRAVVLCRTFGTDLSCTVIGDGPERESLHDLAQDLDLGREVDFRGELPNEEVVRAMRRAHAFVLPCRVMEDQDRDALPTVLLEAMAAGLPCISTPVGGVPEIVDAGRTGMLVPPSDPAALATAIGRLLANPDLRRSMAVGGRARVEKLFDTRSNTAILRQWMSEAAERGCPPAHSLRAVEG